MPQCLIMYSHGPASEGHKARLAALLGHPPLEAADVTTAVQLAPQADIFLGHRYLWQSLPLAPQLKWVQSSAAGVDQILCPAMFVRKPLLTRCPIFAREIAWHALALAMALNRGLPDWLAGQPGIVLPQPHKALILGCGQIGQSLGRLLKGLGIKVMAVQHQQPLPMDSCDIVLTPENWKAHLGAVDWCFLALPLTPATFHILDQAALAALPAHAVVINVGRGATLDTQALIQQLQQGQLGGAFLDVVGAFLPIDCPRLWSTPQVASFCPDRQQRLETFVEEQVSDFIQGKTLQHQVLYLEQYPPDWQIPR